MNLDTLITQGQIAAALIVIAFALVIIAFGKLEQRKRR
jgi:hypothetical protein